MDDNLRRLFEIKRYKSDGFEFITDVIIREVDFNIFVNGKRLISLSVMPEKLEELAYGFLYTENIMHDYEEIVDSEFSFSERYINFEMRVPPDRINSFHRSKTVSSGCCSALSSSICGCRIAFPDFEISAEDLMTIMKNFEEKSRLFKETGAVHSCAVVKGQEIVSFAEDIGRHNALDKVTGDCFRKHIPFGECFILSSGRLTSEIVKKSIRAGFKAVISHSAPTTEAVRLGWDHKIYLIGFVRNKRFNLYTGFDQIRIK